MRMSDQNFFVCLFYLLVYEFDLPLPFINSPSPSVSAPCLPPQFIFSFYLSLQLNPGETGSRLPQVSVSTTWQWYPSTMKSHAPCQSRIRTNKHKKTHPCLNTYHIEIKGWRVCDNVAVTQICTIDIVHKSILYTAMKRDRQRQTHTHAYTNTEEQWIHPQTQTTLTLYGKLRWSVQRLSQLLSRSAAFPLCSALYNQSTTVNVYSEPEEMLPTAKINHFTAPAAWLIRHICLSFSQAWSTGKASMTCEQHLRFSSSLQSACNRFKCFVLQFLHIFWYEEILAHDL